MAPRPLTKPRCHNCRRKKIKRDSQRPQCGRCLKSGLTCEGYVRDLIFVPQNMESPTTTTRELPSPSLSPSLDTESSSRPARRRAVPAAPEPLERDTFYRTQFFNSFMAHYLPAQAIEESHSVRWLDFVADSRKCYRPLDTAAKALGVTVLGQANNDKALRATGIKLYGKALSELREWHARRSPSNRDWHKALLTSMIFQVYETIECPVKGVEGWMSHGSGIAMMVQMAGPEAFQDPAARLTFLCCRVGMIVHSILSETPSVLASPSWRSTPWTAVPKDDLHSLLDILAQVPLLLGLSNRIMALSETTKGLEMKRNDLIHQLGREQKRLDAELDDWHGDMTSRNGQLYILNVSADHSQESCREGITFADQTHVHILHFFWTCRLLIYESGRRVRQTNDGPFSGLPPVRELQLQDNIPALIAVADSIRLSADHCRKSSCDDGTLGMQFTILPLRTALQFYEHQGMFEQQESCILIFERLATWDFPTIAHEPT